LEGAGVLPQRNWLEAALQRLPDGSVGFQHRRAIGQPALAPWQPHHEFTAARLVQQGTAHPVAQDSARGGKERPLQTAQPPIMRVAGIIAASRLRNQGLEQRA
jgi:hypothetical protein